MPIFHSVEALFTHDFHFDIDVDVDMIRERGTSLGQAVLSECILLCIQVTSTVPPPPPSFFFLLFVRLFFHAVDKCCCVANIRLHGTEFWIDDDTEFWIGHGTEC